MGLSSNQATMEDPPEAMAVCVENPAYSRPDGDENEVNPIPKCEVHSTSPELPRENHADVDTNFNIYGNEGPLELPIKVQDLAGHVQDMKNRPNAFKDEYLVTLWTFNNAHYLWWSNKESPICPLSWVQNQLSNNAKQY